MEINKIELANSFGDFVKTRNWDISFNTTLRAPVKTITIVEDGKEKDIVVWRNDTVSIRKEFQFFLVLSISM